MNIVFVSVPYLFTALNPQIAGQGYDNFEQQLLTCIIIASVGKDYVFHQLHSPCRNKSTASI
jgi:hypothetical protein